MISLSRGRVAEMFRVLEAGYPHEACGVLFGTKGDPDRVTAFRPVANVNTERARDRYELEPKGLLAAEREARARGEAVVGVYHSHPDHPAFPSATDLERAWPELTYLIVSVREGQAAEWTCWILDEAGAAFVPRIVRLVD